jgi:hypothetical protein
MKLWFSGPILVLLLVIWRRGGGGVEANPGPLSIKEVEIFAFVKKTEERGAEVKRFMDTTEKTLAGINMVITKQTEKKEKIQRKD